MPLKNNYWLINNTTNWRTVIELALPCRNNCVEHLCAVLF